MYHGKVREEYYDAECPGIQVQMGRYHNIGLLGGRQRDLRGEGQDLRSGEDGGVFGEVVEIDN